MVFLRHVPRGNGTTVFFAEDIFAAIDHREKRFLSERWKAVPEQCRSFLSRTQEHLASRLDMTFESFRPAEKT